MLRIQLEYLEALTSGPPNTVEEELEAYRLAVQGGMRCSEGVEGRVKDFVLYGTICMLTVLSMEFDACNLGNVLMTF